jgi:hypothetical protein
MVNTLGNASSGDNRYCSTFGKQRMEGAIANGNCGGIDKHYVEHTNIDNTALNQRN